LAKRFGIGVEALHPCAAPWQRVPYSTELSPFYSQELIDMGREQVAVEQGDARKWFDKACEARPGIASHFVAVEGFIAQIVGSRARVADLTVVPSIGAKDDAFWSVVREGALIHSGKAMLAVPEGTHAQTGETIVIAWKDGAAAARAVMAAAPFFATAAKVYLVTVEEAGGEAPSLAAMTEYLTLAGVKVALPKVLPASDNIGEALLLEAASQPGALLVMGAYGHWRWREWAFGGVTEHVLRNATVPVLMVH
jgi:nucleotide-binding universal stress UspA family protein